jgi:hypothetical protein
MTSIAFASEHLGPSTPAVAAPIASAAEVTLMRQRMELLRDVLISLIMQLVFRATFLLRHWA